MRCTTSPSSRTWRRARSISSLSMWIDRGRRRGVRDAPQHRAHAREQLLDVERLGHVVVGPGVERGDLVLLSVAGGEHHDGDVAERSHPPQRLDRRRGRGGRDRAAPTSGRRSATSTSPSSAVAHSTTSSDRARRLVRSARRNDVSSSITSTVVTNAPAWSSSGRRTRTSHPRPASPRTIRGRRARSRARARSPGRARCRWSRGAPSTRANSSKMRSRSSSGTPGP